MTSETELQSRCGGKCELCGAEGALSVYDLPHSGDRTDGDIMICATCEGQIAAPDTMDVNHWRCLNDSMWSQVPAVQVMAYRMLKRLSGEGWAQDLLDMLYLEEDLKAWGDAESLAADSDDSAPTLDSNGTPLAAGDTVVIIKDLNVKGTSFVAKRGTAVRNIALTNNPEHIEGRVNGTRIVILSCYVKKS
ncbi:PhnA domain-containing protein [Shewanella algae]|uniref:PhnA domain-containing protein n=1 Tax=Shewanella algae TaxID=38313 RepID=UPI001AADBB9A|nr:alkylphosphonate utilization protein [Shewanella algae]MBO2699782.1 PhnA domain-containing protein [Shewanella algae]